MNFGMIHAYVRKYEINQLCVYLKFLTDTHQIINTKINQLGPYYFIDLYKNIDTQCFIK